MKTRFRPSGRMAGLVAVLVLAACSDSAPLGGGESSSGAVQAARAEFERVQSLERGCCQDAESAKP
jgi:hypothetical protein